MPFLMDAIYCMIYRHERGAERRLRHNRDNVDISSAEPKVSLLLVTIGSKGTKNGPGDSGGLCG